MRSGSDRGGKANSNVKKIKPNKEQAAVEKTFPAIANWLRSYGHIEIGDQDGFGYIVRALDYGGLILEDSKPRALVEAMVSLENALARWFEDEGIEVVSQ